MKFTRKSRPEAEVPTGSFADIAFLLIVFFILTTTLVQPAGSDLKIPSGKSDPKQAERKQLTITLQDSRIFFGEKGTEVTLDDLRERLAAEKLMDKSEDDRIVILEAAPNVKWQEYFEVLNAIKTAGGVVALIEREKAEKAETAEKQP